MRYALVAFLLCSIAAPAAAQVAAPSPSAPSPGESPPTAPPAEQAPPPPDLVTTRDGGILRGTILEHVPGEYTVIQLATGETQRLEASAITYAGPADAVSERGPSAPIDRRQVAPDAPPTRDLRLQLRANDHGVTFHAVATGPNAGIEGGAPSFERLCTAPCEAMLPPGAHRLGLSLGDAEPIAAGSVEITRDGMLLGDYADNHSIRIIGWLTLGLGLAVGVTLMLLPVFGVSAIDSDATYIYLGVGAGVAVATGITGGILAALPDQAVIRFD